MGGTDRKDVIQLLLPVFADARSNMEVVGVAALACGLIAVGSCNGEVTSTILQTLMEKCETDVAGMKESYAKYLPLGIGLCYLGKQDAAEATMAALEVIPEPFRQTAVTLVEVCAYAGTGNVLKIQQLLHICSEHYEQAVDVVGQAGKPKTITGFQTHTTPVLLAHGERAELATEEYIPVTSIMEGFVILKKNPDF